MSVSPRPAKPVSAHIQRFALVGTLALAGAVVLQVTSNAATRRHPAHRSVSIAVHPRAYAGPASYRRAASSETSGHHGQKAARMHAASTRAGTQTGRRAKLAIRTSPRDSRNRRTFPAPLTKGPHIERASTEPQKDTRRATEDRVHAWYTAHHPAESSPSTEAAVKVAPAKLSPQGPLPAVQTPAPIVRVDVPATAKPVIQLSQAALQSDEAAHAAAAVSASHISTDDDAAIAEESHIPSTAPTERTSTPFTHGDFNIAGTATGSAAPVLRASSPAANALLASSKPVPVETLSQQITTSATFANTPVRLAPADEDAANAASLVKVNLYDSAGKLILIPPMKGTHEILVHQNEMAVADGLQRIGNDAQMAAMRRSQLLVALPETAGIGVDERLPLNRRYARPWSVRFLNDLARAHYARFHSPLIVTSAVRTVAFQRHLVQVNGNAAPPTGDVASPHLYGQAVDIAKHGMTTTELAWMRAYLTPVETEGKIDVEEEFQQACFHISIYRSYFGTTGKQTVPAQDPAPAYTLQQAKATPLKHRRIPSALLAMRLR